MRKFTQNEKQIIRNAINFFEENNRIVKPRLIALIENDVNFIENFNKEATIFNDRAESKGWPLTATFDEQINWDIDAFREIKEIREFEA